MTDWYRRNASIVWSWAVLIAAAAVFCGATRGTGLAQLAMGLLVAAIALLIAMAIFELIWQAAAKAFSSDAPETPRSPPKSRRRGQ
jgi:hypothetical protein